MWEHVFHFHKHLKSRMLVNGFLSISIEFERNIFTHFIAQPEFPLYKVGANFFVEYDGQTGSGM